MQVRSFLADYSLDLEVYDYWLWRYYPEWIDWYRNQQSQTALETPPDAAVTEAASGDAAIADSNAADAQDSATGMVVLTMV